MRVPIVINLPGGRAVEVTRDDEILTIATGFQEMIGGGIKTTAVIRLPAYRAHELADAILNLAPPERPRAA